MQAQEITENLDINLNWYQIQTEIRKQVFKLLIPFQKELQDFRKEAKTKYGLVDKIDSRLKICEAFCKIDTSEMNQKEVINMLTDIGHNVAAQVTRSTEHDALKKLEEEFETPSLDA